MAPRLGQRELQRAVRRYNHGRYEFVGTRLVRPSVAAAGSVRSCCRSSRPWRAGDPWRGRRHKGWRPTRRVASRSVGLGAWSVWLERGRGVGVRMESFLGSGPWRLAAVGARVEEFCVGGHECADCGGSSEAGQMPLFAEHRKMGSGRGELGRGCTMSDRRTTPRLGEFLCRGVESFGVRRWFVGTKTERPGDTCTCHKIPKD